MPEPELTEVLLAKEFGGLGMNCANFETCAYRKASVKLIIQCELYEMDFEHSRVEQRSSISKGLCANCYNADSCRLPDRKFGVWHCEEYE